MDLRAAFLGVLLASALSVGLRADENLPPESAERVFAPLAVVIRMDANGDGVLDIGEIPEGAEAFVLELLLEAERDPLDPVSLPEVSAAWVKVAKRKLEAEAAANSESEADQQSSLSHEKEKSPNWQRAGVLALTHSIATGISEIDHELESIFRMDKNDDGKLQLDEIPSQARASVWQFLDREGYSLNGKAIDLAGLAAKRKKSRSEFAKSVKPASTATTSNVPETDKTQTQDWLRRATEIIAIYDADQDGNLVEEEWSRLNPTWGEADENRDGRLTAEEIAVELMNLTKLK